MKSSTTPAGYLTKFQTAFLNLHDRLAPSDQEDWMNQFRRQSSALNLDQGVSLPKGADSREEVRQALAPENPAAQEWAQERVARGWLPLPDPTAPFAAFDLL